jgi:Tfp pilus assembly protein PilV
MAIIIVIVGLVVAVMLMTAILQTAAARRTAARTAHWQLQAEWLAESAVDRAAARLRSDSAYTGETWKLAANETGLADAGLVVIEVKPHPDEPRRRVVSVVADFPDHPHDRARCQRKLTLAIPSGEKP